MAKKITIKRKKLIEILNKLIEVESLTISMAKVS